MILVSALFFLSLSPLLAKDLRNPQFFAQARKGFTEIYNLEYDEAAQTFSALKREYPEHPAPPLYVGLTIWLRELFERQELDLNLFIAPGYFTRPAKGKMAPERRRAFLNEIQSSQDFSRKILEKDPGNKDARYFLGASYGILGSFVITVDQSRKQALSNGKQAYKYHHQLVKENGEYYDAYLTVGLYEYIVDNLPWYVKWLAILLGYRGSEERGLRYLATAAEKASFVADDARLLQTILYVREGRNGEALENARYLHERYPRNYILHLNRAQILERMGKKGQAAEQYFAVIKRAEARAPNYHMLLLSAFRYQVGNKFMQLNRWEWALDQFQKSIQSAQTPRREKALSCLRAGQILDLAGRRSEAMSYYEQVLTLENIEESHRQAKRFLKRPYRQE